jgi:hypothetical protein
MYESLKNAVATSNPDLEVDVVTPAMVRYQNFPSDEGLLLCPLTIDLPEQIFFHQRELFEACRQVDTRRHWVLEHTEHKVCNNGAIGDHWLPIIASRDGYRFGEVIGEGIMPNSYHQPINLTEAQRASVQDLGVQLLDSISASPSVYLLQFAFTPNREIVFDRLWPFPAAPAIASLNHPTPNLFDYHWRCLTNQSLEIPQPPRLA